MTPRANVYFCGAGGSTQGLVDAGFVCVGFDVWPVAVATHAANGHPATIHDLSNPALDGLLPECELAWFSTPCQPFSAAGEGEGEFDERDGFPWALRIIGKTLPAVVIFENVKGLTFAKHRAYLSGILASVRALGYTLDHKVLNCADYGVPQTRERFICVARRDGGRITWPVVTHTETAGMFTEPWVSMADALGWAGDVQVTAGRDANATVRSASKPAPTVLGRKDPNAWTWLDRRTNSTYGGGEVGPTAPVSTDRPSPAVVTSNGQWLWVHQRPATSINGDCRVSAPGRHDPEVSGSQQADAIRVSIDELAILQGFPKGWVWCGNKTEQARQVGNAVPARLAQVVAQANMPIMEVARAS